MTRGLGAEREEGTWLGVGEVKPLRGSSRRGRGGLGPGHPGLRDSVPLSQVLPQLSARCLDTSPGGQQARPRDTLQGSLPLPGLHSPHFLGKKLQPWALGLVGSPPPASPGHQGRWGADGGQGLSQSSVGQAASKPTSRSVGDPRPPAVAPGGHGGAGQRTKEAGHEADPSRGCVPGACGTASVAGAKGPWALPSSWRSPTRPG